MKKKKNGKSIHFLILLTLLFSIFVISFTNELEDFAEASIIDINRYKKDEMKSCNIFGIYKVSKDKKSYLNLNDKGEYELSVNVCNGYLKLKGHYERVNNKLKLINTSNNKEYNTLKDNSEISFIIIDDNTIMLNEDLECLIQGTLFER